MLQDAVSRGIASARLDVVQFGLAYIPAMFNRTFSEDDAILCPVDGAIMITASHFPYKRNGFKLFTNVGGFLLSDFAEFNCPHLRHIVFQASNKIIFGISYFPIVGSKDDAQRLASIATNISAGLGDGNVENFKLKFLRHLAFSDRTSLNSMATIVITLILDTCVN